jgi:hypothetical protein
MGREIETAMLADACAIAGTGLWAAVAEAPRNHPARAFFARHGCTEIGRPALVHAPTWPSHIELVPIDPTSDDDPTSPVLTSIS